MVIRQLVISYVQSKPNTDPTYFIKPVMRFSTDFQKFVINPKEVIPKIVNIKKAERFGNTDSQAKKQADGSFLVDLGPKDKGSDRYTITVCLHVLLSTRQHHRMYRQLRSGNTILLLKELFTILKRTTNFSESPQR